MADPFKQLRHPYLKGWLFQRPNILSEKAALDAESATPMLAGKGYDEKDTRGLEVRIVEGDRVITEVDVNRRDIPTITYLEIARFVIWSIILVLHQAWRDFREKRPFRPTLATEPWTHYYYIPMSIRHPRVVVAGCSNRILTKIIPLDVTRRYEESYDLSQVEPSNLINCASNNYGGFAELEYGAEKVIEAGLRKLPFCPAPATLEEQVRRECAAYMDCEACVTAPSGFSTNVLAFATVANVARSQGRKLVFLCDGDCHNSMFTGAFFNRDARMHRFKHNDLTDLEYKLRMYKEQAPSTMVCVAVEGIYSLEGSISPGPAILALKKAYKFTLLVDEAHSFMALGSAGRGSFNHWQDQGYECPLSEVDVMSCMFSKSVGCTGGFVLANREFAVALRQGGEELNIRGAETLSTVGLLRILNLLRKPALIARRMALVREKAKYVAKALQSTGCHILSAPGSAVICFPVGAVSQVSIFHGEAVIRGVATAGAGPPATPVWGCRLRLCIFATTTWPDIYRLLTVVTHVCVKIGIRGVRPTSFDPVLLTRSDPPDDDVQRECDRVDAQMLSYVDELSTDQAPLSMAKRENHNYDQRTHVHDEAVRQAGVEALRQYSIGPCSARWFYGSFEIFITLERRLAAMYPSLVAQCGPCRAMICGDAEITIGSTLTALMMRPHAKNTVNRVFVPSNAPHSVMAGAKLRRPSKHISLTFFNDLQDLLAKIDDAGDSRFFMTIYLETVANGVLLDLTTLLSEAAPRLQNLTGLTIMLDDRNGLGKIGPQSLGYLNLMEATHGVEFLKNSLSLLKCRTQVVVAGSWFDAFHHQGGYVTGTASTVECLTWDAKAFFYSTPPMPLQAAMSDRMLSLLSEQPAKHEVSYHD